MAFQSPPNDRGLERDSDVPLTSRAVARGRWLSINEACHMLGVDQSTLRRWSDAGKVPVFRTPGGHRRYAEEDLRALIGGAGRRIERPRVNAQQLTDRSLSAFEEGFWQGARARRWFRAFSHTKHDELRLLGRRLVDLAVRFAATPDSADRLSWLEEGRQIGEQYGQSGARAGLTCEESVEAFIYFRSPVVRAVTGMIEEQGLAAHRAARVFVEIGLFMDQVLMAMVGAHESAKAMMPFTLPNAAATEPPPVGDV